MRSLGLGLLLCAACAAPPRGVPVSVAAPRTVRNADAYEYAAWAAPDSATPSVADTLRRTGLAALDAALHLPPGPAREPGLRRARVLLDSAAAVRLTEATSLARHAARVEWARHLALAALTTPTCAAAQRARFVADTAAWAIQLCDIGSCPRRRERLGSIAFSAVVVSRAQVDELCPGAVPGAG